jgi:DNA processing protein
LATSLNDQERHDRLRLTRSENVGPVTYRDLMDQFGSAGEALAALPELARRGGRKRAIKIASEAAADRERRDTERLGAKLFFVGEEDYPTLLAQTDPPPPVVSVMGASHLLHQPCMAIVGSRSASAAGLRMAANIAGDLGSEKFIIVSGFARGIDTAAHQASIATGTIAVVAGGLDVVYPAENQPLYDQIKDQGAMVSEMPPGTKPQGRHFPRRNRIISGLSKAVIVVEAALRSGSLITAQRALEQNRELLVVPGSPLDPRARGSNRLIKQGAALVENAEDIINWMEQAPLPLFSEAEEKPYRTEKTKSPDPTEANRKTICSLLGPTSVEQDDLIRRSGLPPQIVIALLLELDLAGRLTRDTGQRVALLEPQNVDNT